MKQLLQSTICTLVLLGFSQTSTLALSPIVNPPPPLPSIGSTGPNNFPQSLADSILQSTAQATGLPLSSLQITATISTTWPNGCLGIYPPGAICTMALVDGWIVTVSSPQQQWVYHTSNSGRFQLASGSLPRDLTPPLIGFTQTNPILPTTIDQDEFVFTDVPTDRWFDPPTTYGFAYQMRSNSLFTSILDFPVGIDADNRFGISVANRYLGEFGPGQSVDFVALLGNGVSSFTLTGIDPLVDGTNPTAFPLKLAFNTPTADFTMRALNQPKSTSSVPEPSLVIGLLLMTGCGMVTRTPRA